MSGCYVALFSVVILFDSDCGSVCAFAALRNQAPLRAWGSSSQGSQGGMCSDSESAGGSSESRSMDSPTASPGKRTLNFKTSHKFTIKVL